MLEIINEVLLRFWVQFSNFVPNFIGGVLILAIGFLFAEIVKKIILTLFAFIKLESLLAQMKLLQKPEVKLWEEIIAEIAKWTVVILFLIPTLEVWGLSRATLVLNQFLFYLPNVFVAVVIAFVGLIVGNLASDVVRHSIKTMGATSANTFAVFAKTAILFFTVLIVMNQLGVAQDLIRILFTGIIAMLALAGGLAFGLGGHDMAKELLDEMKKKVS